MNKEDKRIVLNGIDVFSAELERLLPSVRYACKFGLHKGKFGNAEWIAVRCRQLAEELETYADEEFTLDDLQDYVY